MKAVVCEAFGGPEVLSLREVPDPAPPGPGEIQVRIAARGVQYVDVLMLAGKYQFKPEPPSSPVARARARSWRSAPTSPTSSRATGHEPAPASAPSRAGQVAAPTNAIRCRPA